MTGNEFNRLLIKISLLPDEVKNQILNQAMNRVTKRIQASAKLKAPVNQGDLRRSIMTKVSIEGESIKGKVYTNSDHAVYVEFGTGPEGASNHSGISPNVSVSYKSTGWFIPGEYLWTDDIEKYHFKEFELEDGGSLYWTDGQQAQPFLYPAFSEIEPQIKKIFRNSLIRAFNKVASK